MFMAMTGVGRFVTENGKMENNYFHQSPAVTESIRTDWRGRQYMVRHLNKGIRRWRRGCALRGSSLAPLVICNLQHEDLQPYWKLRCIWIHYGERFKGRRGSQESYKNTKQFTESPNQHKSISNPTPTPERAQTQRSNLQPSCCELTVPTTAPPCCPHQYITIIYQKARSADIWHFDFYRIFPF